MASGADESGDDMVVGRTNQSEERTLLIARNGDNAPDGYAEDFVLDVSIAGDRVLTNGAHGVDGIHASGSVEFPTGGAIGTIPAGNGIVARGLNGIVGYVQAALRDKTEEMNSQSGVVGEGGASAAGIFGRGQNGLVGCEQGTPRDAAFEARETAGVLGRGPIGVTGDGLNGPGVHGRGLPGVMGESPGGPGVLGEGDTGLVGRGRGGPGILSESDRENAAVFESKRRAQVWIVPLDSAIADPSKLPGHAEPGELCVTIGRDQRGSRIASLWFCASSPGAASLANWVKLA